MADVVRLSEGMKPEAFFEKDTGLNVPLLGDVIRREHSIKRGHDGRLYAYVEGVYRPIGDQVVKARIRELLGPRFKARHLFEILKYLETFPPEVGQEQPAGLLNVANGLLAWERQELRPHSLEVLSTIQLPVRWNPRAQCPAFDRFLAEVLPRDAIELVWEAVGYLLYPGNPLRKAIMLLGPGANGKSLLLRVMEAVAGPENVAHVALQQLAEDRFAPAELYLKLGNLYADLDARAVRFTDTFKLLTGGDTMRGERKFRDGFRFRPMALPVFSANTPPLSHDQSEAWFSRWVVVPMKATIPEERRDPHLAEKLTEPTELEGILVSAVGAMRRLLRRGRFEVPASVRDAGEDYREHVDSAAAFLREACVLEPEAWVARTELYRTYRRWCGEAGRHPLADRNFYERLARLGLTPAKRHGVRGFWGLRFASGGGAEEELAW